jgi:hypothetical protein
MKLVPFFGVEFSVHGQKTGAGDGFWVSGFGIWDLRLRPGEQGRFQGLTQMNADIRRLTRIACRWAAMGDGFRDVGLADMSWDCAYSCRSDRRGFGAYGGFGSDLGATSKHG